MTEYPAVMGFQDSKHVLHFLKNMKTQTGQKCERNWIKRGMYNWIYSDKCML